MYVFTARFHPIAFAVASLSGCACTVNHNASKIQTFRCMKVEPGAAGCCIHQQVFWEHSRWYQAKGVRGPCLTSVFLLQHPPKCMFTLTVQSASWHCTLACLVIFLAPAQCLSMLQSRLWWERYLMLSFLSAVNFLELLVLQWGYGRYFLSAIYFVFFLSCSPFSSFTLPETCSRGPCPAPQRATPFSVL